MPIIVSIANYLCLERPGDLEENPLLPIILSQCNC